jgi:hypothetical protein
MSSAKITLFTFARWMNENGKDLFLNLTVPQGLQKSVLVDNILLRGGEFEVVYSDPDFMQYAIGSWSAKWQRTMQKWIEALSIDYNPLENYDRYETIQDKSEKTNKMDRTLDHRDETLINTQDLRTLNTNSLNTRNLMDEENRNLTDKETRDLDDTTTYNHTTKTEELVSAYDSSSYQPSAMTINTNGVESGGQITDNTDKLEQDGTDTFEHTGKDIFIHTGYDDTKQTGTDTMNRTGTEGTSHTGTIKDNGGEDAFNDHTAHIHGNIGVTTSQQMLEAELDISKWNIYEHITDLFLTEFVIPIYT